MLQERGFSESGPLGTSRSYPRLAKVPGMKERKEHVLSSAASRHADSPMYQGPDSGRFEFQVLPAPAGPRAIFPSPVDAHSPRLHTMLNL